MSIITAFTKIPARIVNKIQNRELERGYEPSVYEQILLKYVEDTPRSGRPLISESVRDLIIQVVIKNSVTRQFPTN
jgi:hypothetical protein